MIYKMGDWRKDHTFQDIAVQYTAYVSRHYMNESIVICDGYPAKLAAKDRVMEKGGKI